MAAPTNTSALTAIDLGTLPASTTQDVHDAGTTYPVWYTYTPPADVTWISVWGHGADPVYHPTLSTWIGPASAPVAYLGITSDNLPAQLLVTPGTPYYFKLTPNSGNPTPAILELSVLRGARYDVPAGAIAVNDDTEGGPLVFIDVATGTILNSRAFPAGEAGDTLASGQVLVADSWNGTLSVHDPTMAAVGTLPYVGGASEAYAFVRAHAATDTFFVGDRSNGDVRTVTTAAVFGSTTWTTGANLTALAANLDASLLYYASAAAAQVEQWNLTTNTTAGAFAPEPTGYQATDILTLADGTVLINYAQSGFATAQRVIHYSAAAAVLHTFDIVDADLVRPAGTVARIATSLDDPLSFWLWTHHEGGVSQFREIQISDGATLQTVTTTEFENGESTAPDGTTVRFGHSYSCTFWVVRQPIPDIDGPLGAPPEPEPEPSPHLEARYIRRLRRAPHVAHEQKRVFYRSFELDLERGQALASGQGSDPVVLLRISRDGGQTWGEEIRMAVGRLGAYQARVLARRLGHARDTVFEVVVSDPVAWSLVGAWLDLEAGTS